MSRYVISNILGLIGAAVGGVAGCYIYWWIFDQGFIGGMIPGAFVGLGCSLLARHISIVRGVACGVGGLFLGFYADWSTNKRPLPPFLDYLKDVKNVNQVYLLMILLGAAIAFWLGKDAGIAGRARREEPPGQPVKTPEPDQGKLS